MSVQNPPAPETPPVKTYTEEEVIQRVEAARKEEKQKLYSEIESLKLSLKDSDLTKTERDSLAAKLKDAEGQLNVIVAARKDGQLDPLVLVKQVAEDTRKAVTGEYDNRFREMEQKLSAADERARKQELSAHREKLIAAAQGRIIPAMVVGTTVEELNASAEESKRQYEDIRASSTTQNPPSNSVNPPPPVAPRSSNGGSGEPPASGLDAFKRTNDPAAYGQSRKQTLAALKQKFG